MRRACVKLACCLGGALLIFLHQLPARADDCADSVSQEDLVSSLEQESSAPITVSPKTFIRLQPEIRKALSGRLRICPSIPLNERGEPYTRLKMDFADIWEAFEIAANAGDWEEAQFIANAVQANPLPPAALMSLLTVPLWSPDSMAKAAKILRIMPVMSSGLFFCWTHLIPLAARPLKKPRSSGRPITKVWRRPEQGPQQRTDRPYLRCIAAHTARQPPGFLPAWA